MILEEETFKKFGYYSNKLKSQSHKIVITKCDVCGKVREQEYRYHHNLCQTCANRKSRIIKYPFLSNKMWLYQKYIVEEKSSVIIASEIGCSPSSVCRGLRMCEIPTRCYGKTCKGKSLSLPTRLKMSESRKRRVIQPMTEKHHSKETKEKMSKMRKGKHHPNWKGGISGKSYEECFNMTMIEWKKLAIQIRERDKYICQYCGKKRSIEVHHIMPRRIEIDNYPYNLITLCKSCHHKVEKLTDKYIEQNRNPVELFYEKWSKQ